MSTQYDKFIHILPCDKQGWFKLTPKEQHHLKFKHKMERAKGLHWRYLEDYEKLTEKEIEDLINSRRQECRKVICIETKKEGSIIYDEVIAEAVHDYYLHENSSSKSTIEIINTLKERLI